MYFKQWEAQRATNFNFNVKLYFANYDNSFLNDYKLRALTTNCMHDRSLWTMKFIGTCEIKVRLIAEHRSAQRNNILSGTRDAWRRLHQLLL